MMAEIGRKTSKVKNIHAQIHGIFHSMKILSQFLCLVVTSADSVPVDPFVYSHATHNDVSVNDGQHIRQWSHNII